MRLSCRETPCKGNQNISLMNSEGFLKFYKKWEKTIFVLLLIILFSSVIRFYNLNELPVFADEAIYVRWAQIIKNEPTLRFIPLSDGKQPLFMWTLWPMLSLFSDPLIAGRFLSVLTGIVTLLGIFTASYLLFNSKKAALFAAFLYALSPFSVFYDRLALVDSMLSMFGTLSFVFGILTVKHKRIDTALFTGFALGAAWLTKSPAIFFIILMPTLLILANWSKKTPKNLFVAGGLLLLSVVVAFIMYNILRLGPNFHLLSSRNFDYVYPYSHILKEPFNPFISHLGAMINYYILLAPVGLIILAFISKLSFFKKFKKEFLVVLLWWLIPLIAVAMYSKTMTARYIYFTFPYLILLSSPAILLIKKGKSTLIYLTSLIFLLQSIYTNYLLLTSVERAPLPRSERSGYLEEWTAGHGIREVSGHLIKEYDKDPNQGIVVGTEGYFGTLPDGLQIYLQNYPEIIVKGIGLGLNEVPESLKESVESGNKTYLVINNTRHQIGHNTEELNLIELFPKAQKPDGSVEELLFLRVR